MRIVNDSHIIGHLLLFRRPAVQDRQAWHPAEVPQGRFSVSGEAVSGEEVSVSAEAGNCEGLVIVSVRRQGASTGRLSEPDPQAHKPIAIQYVINKMRSRADNLGIRIKIVTSCCYCSRPVTLSGVKSRWRVSPFLTGT